MLHDHYFTQVRRTQLIRGHLSSWPLPQNLNYILQCYVYFIAKLLKYLQFLNLQLVDVLILIALREPLAGFIKSRVCWGAPSLIGKLLIVVYPQPVPPKNEGIIEHLEFFVRQRLRIHDNNIHLIFVLLVHIPVLYELVPKILRGTCWEMLLLDILNIIEVETITIQRNILVWAPQSVVVGTNISFRFHCVIKVRLYLLLGPGRHSLGDLIPMNPLVPLIVRLYCLQ